MDDEGRISETTSNDEDCRTISDPHLTLLPIDFDTCQTASDLLLLTDWVPGEIDSVECCI